MNRRELLGAVGATAALAVLPADAAITLCCLQTGYAMSSVGKRIYFEVHGKADGPNLILLTPILATGSPGQTELFLAHFTDRYRVLVADYAYGTGLSEAAPASVLTATQVCADMLALADAAGMAQFGLAGYSFGGNSAEQVATRTSRVAALAVGGWPALGGPYAALLQLSQNIANLDPLDLTRTHQYVTYYSGLQNWPELAQVSQLAMPRLNFVDSTDNGTLLGGTVDMIGPFRANRAQLTQLGWETQEVNSGLGHSGGMLAPFAGPMLRDFFDRHL